MNFDKHVCTNLIALGFHVCSLQNMSALAQSLFQKHIANLWNCVMSMNLQSWCGAFSFFAHGRRGGTEARGLGGAQSKPTTH